MSVSNTAAAENARYFVIRDTGYVKRWLGGRVCSGLDALAGYLRNSNKTA